MRRLQMLGMAIALSGCGTIVSQTFQDVGEEIPVTAPSNTAAIATIAIAPGVADGPGISIADVITTASGGPDLVNGVLFLDAAGVIWLCDSVVEASPPECGEPRLLVENFPSGTATFDPESAEITGAQFADGVVWLLDQQLYGTVTP